MDGCYKQRREQFLGLYFIHLCCSWRMLFAYLEGKKPLRQGRDGVPFAKEAELQDPNNGTFANIPLDGSVALVPLWSSLFGGKRRFIEKPS